MVKRRPSTYALLALVCAALTVPAVASASSGSGGSGLGEATGTGTTTPGPSTVATPTPSSGKVVVSTSGDGITLRTSASALLRKRLTFSGSAPSAVGKTIVIERSGHQTSWKWAQTVDATVAADGSFTVTWATNHIGRFAVRAVMASADGSGASAASVTPSLTTTVYRPSEASWYGPGMYGTRTACGTTLTKATIGVANKTLPCGMRVAIYYRGQTLTVPVIDHGPYVAGRDWDLTAETAKMLGIEGVAMIGAVSLPTR
jgi:rare lipoprotein A